MNPILTNSKALSSTGSFFAFKTAKFSSFANCFERHEYHVSDFDKHLITHIDKAVMDLFIKAYFIKSSSR